MRACQMRCMSLARRRIILAVEDKLRNLYTYVVFKTLEKYQFIWESLEREKWRLTCKKVDRQGSPIFLLKGFNQRKGHKICPRNQ